LTSSANERSPIVGGFYYGVVAEHAGVSV